MWTWSRLEQLVLGAGVIVFLLSIIGAPLYVLDTKVATPWVTELGSEQVRALSPVKYEFVFSGYRTPAGKSCIIKVGSIQLQDGSFKRYTPDASSPVVLADEGDIAVIARTFTIAGRLATLGPEPHRVRSCAQYECYSAIAGRPHVATACTGWASFPEENSE